MPKWKISKAPEILSVAISDQEMNENLEQIAEALYKMSCQLRSQTGRSI